MCQSYIQGTVTLVSGTKTLTALGIPANAFISLMLTTPGGTLGTSYKFTGIGTSGGFTVTSIGTTGSTVTTDTSTFAWSAECPLFHADQSAVSSHGDGVLNPTVSNLTVTAASATDLPTSIASANNIKTVLNIMMADTTAHLAADATNPVVAAAAVDLATTITLLNACQTAFNAHLTQAGVHVFNDTVNTNSTTVASDLTTSEALANAMKASVNAHLASAPLGESVRLVSA